MEDYEFDLAPFTEHCACGHMNATQNNNGASLHMMQRSLMLACIGPLTMWQVLNGTCRASGRMQVIQGHKMCLIFN